MACFFLKSFRRSFVGIGERHKKARQASSRAGRSPQARGTWGVRGLFVPCRDEVFVLFHLERSEHRYALGCVIPAVDVVTRLI